MGRSDIQAVFVATPHFLHAEQSIAAAKAGKHILIEKPMATSVADCDAILEACKSAGVYSSVAFSQRTRICNIKAREIIAAGKLGAVQQIVTWQVLPIGMAGLPKWQSDPENVGGLIGHAIHNIDGIRWFSGQEIKTVYAKCTSYEADVKVEGTSMAVMTLTGGAMATLWSSFQLPKPGLPSAQYRVRIVGEKGLIDMDAYGELRVAIDGEWRVEATQAPIDWQGMGFLDPVRLESYTLFCQDLIDAIVEKRPPAITGWDGRQAVAAAVAAYESSRTGKEVVLS